MSEPLDHEQHEKNQDQRIKELERRLAETQHTVEHLHEAFEDRVMQVIEALCSAVGGVVGASRAKSQLRRQGPTVEMRLAGTQEEPSNEQTFRVTLAEDGIKVEQLSEGQWGTIPPTAVDELFQGYLREQGIAIGVPTLINLYQLH
jgi:hypothetical protein